MNLILQTNSNPLHTLEFVDPIEDILKLNNIPFFTKNYLELNKYDLEKAERIIICGTSLKDNQFLNNIDRFSWLPDFKKPILGICAGMQIISLIFGARLKKKTEIGFYTEIFSKKFLGKKGKTEVYHLHDNYTILPKEFMSLTESKIPQAIKHKKKKIYGVLFHPEVRNKEIIENFCRKAI